MSLFKGSLRPPTIWSDEVIERDLAALRTDVEIDPLFRRRLRGQVVNRYVAAREGLDAGESSRHMGRLGRAVAVRQLLAGRDRHERGGSLAGDAARRDPVSA